MNNKVHQALQSAVDKLQVWDEIVNEAKKDGVFDGAGERLVAQACAGLEPIKRMKPLFDHMSNNLIPLSARFHIRHYQQKDRVQ